MFSSVPKFQGADRCEQPGCGVREHRPQCGAEGFRCFQAEGRAAGQLWMSIFFWVSIERDLDFLWIGFLGVNFKDLTKPIRFRVRFDCMDVLA